MHGCSTACRPSAPCAEIGGAGRPRRSSPSPPTGCPTWSPTAASTASRGWSSCPPGTRRAAPDGRERQRELVRQARSYGMRIIGPNAFGIINTAAGGPAERLPRAPDAGARPHRPVHPVRGDRHRPASGAAPARRGPVLLRLRRATGRTSPATTSSSTGTRTRTPTSSCCTSNPSATRGSSPASPGVPPPSSRSWSSGAPGTAARPARARGAGDPRAGRDRLGAAAAGRRDPGRHGHRTRRRRPAAGRPAAARRAARRDPRQLRVPRAAHVRRLPDRGPAAAAPAGPDDGGDAGGLPRRARRGAAGRRLRRGGRQRRSPGSARTGSPSPATARSWPRPSARPRRRPGQARARRARRTRRPRRRPRRGDELGPAGHRAGPAPAAPRGRATAPRGQPPTAAGYGGPARGGRGAGPARHPGRDPRHRRAVRIPAYPAAERAVRALAEAVRYAQWRRAAAEPGKVPRVRGHRRGGGRRLHRGAARRRHPRDRGASTLRARTPRRLLPRYGIPVRPPSRPRTPTQPSSPPPASATRSPSRPPPRTCATAPTSAVCGSTSPTRPNCARLHRVDRPLGKPAELQPVVQAMVPRGVDTVVRAAIDPAVGAVLSFGLAGARLRAARRHRPPARPGHRP